MNYSTTEDRPLHELLSRLLSTESPLEKQQPPFPWMGTLQGLNNRLEPYPLADFVNYTLRGIGQVIFVNNPISGALILLALLIQSPWVAGLGLLGVVASTLTALGLGLDRDTVRNGIFGYNGLLVGAALTTFGDLAANALGWAIATVVFAALTTVLMKTLGTWWAKVVKTPPLTLPFNLATLACLALVPVLPGLERASNPAAVSASFSWMSLSAALPVGFGQVFLADRLIAGLLILLAVALCTPLGALVGLVGSLVGVLSGLLFGVSLETLYAGLWGYNAVLCAMAIGGVFYAPTGRSVLAGAIAAFLSAPIGGLLGLVLRPLGLPVLTVPFCLVTIVSMVALTRSLPSLVPVALHAVTSPEEHWQRYRAASQVINTFRQQLVQAVSGQPGNYLFEQASPAIKGDLKYAFNLIDTDQNQTLSLQELSGHLHQAGQVPADAELAYLFNCIDRDGSGAVDFGEFGELMLRHRRLMANYEAFTTYFFPIDVDGDEAISVSEMNTAIASVGQMPLTQEESMYIKQRSQGVPLTWNRFIEMLLLT